jgi:2-polyprenyl-3-methyl-5-hydroxy-6-metoxy-1,4-benzoquinol methylase
MADAPTAGRALGLPPGVPEEATGQDEKKYTTSNPVVLKLIGRWLQAVRDAIGTDPGLVVDVGTGEGFALERTVPAGTPVLGVEYRAGKIRAAAQRLPHLSGMVGDAGMLPVRSHCAPVVTCIEVLEHLTDPAVAVQELARITKGHCVVSVPWEPWFRLGNLGRGKNVARIGNDPEHVQQFNARKLRALLGTHFTQVDVRTCLPWVIAVARP